MRSFDWLKVCITWRAFFLLILVAVHDRKQGEEEGGEELHR